MQKYKLSIIVPVYNTQQYLPKCIHSLLSQKLHNFEILLIDDGSTDGTEKLCDDYQQKYSRIKVVHQTNQGVSMARNIGVQIAQGEYIAFVDSDDWIEDEMYLTMINLAEKYQSDIVKCGFTTDKGIETFKEKQKVIDKNLINEWFKPLNGFIWNAIYKSNIAKSVIYPQNIKNGEDDYASFFYLYYAKKLVIINNCFYHYVGGNPISSQLNSNKEYMRAKAADCILQTIEEKQIHLDKNIIRKVNQHWSRKWFHAIRDERVILPINKLIKVFQKLNTGRKILLCFFLLKNKIIYLLGAVLD